MPWYEIFIFAAMRRGVGTGIGLWAVWMGLVLAALPTRAQYGPNDQRRDATAPLAEIEAELQQLAHTVLHHLSTPHKDSVNQLLMRRLDIVLRRPESYHYPFEQLKTISRLYPQDQSFRIFTWTAYHFDSLRRPLDARYFGIIQRQASPRPRLYFLQDVVEPHERLSSDIGTPDRWFGALYYHPRNSSFGVLTYSGYVRSQHGLTGRKLRQPVSYYIVLGLNQHNPETNYKLIDVITFDPLDTNAVYFGAPIFYMKSGVPHKRVVFEYSDNSPFTLNLAYVLSSRTGTRRKQLMLVFDHIDRQGNSPQQRRLAAGADGTNDAFFFYKKKWIDQRKGLFFFLRDVAVYEPGIEHYRPEELKRQKRADERRRQSTGVPFRSTPRRR